MGEELCCVYSCWEQVLYPILKPGSHENTEQRFKEYFERPQFLHCFVRMRQDKISVSCVSVQDEEQDTRTWYQNNSGR